MKAIKMRLGCFGFVKDLDAIAKAGFDCAEMHIKEFMAMSDAEFINAKRVLKDCEIPAEVFDNPIPLDSWICSENFDLKYYRNFLEKAFDRIAELGAKAIVFGNGKARSLPVEGNILAAQAKFDEFFTSLLDLTAARNIIVLIEPLAKKLSNIVNSLPDANDFIGKYQRSNLKTLVDYRWMVEEGRSLAEIENYKTIIHHIHIDNPLSPFPTRIVPKLNDGFDYGPFFEMLKKIAFRGIISIEASVFQDFSKEIREGLELFRAYDIIPYKTNL